VSESEFQEFEKDAQEHAEFPVSDDEHFDEPAEEVSRNVHVDRVSNVEEVGDRVFRSVESTVSSVGFFWKGDTEVFVEELLEEEVDIFFIQEKDVNQDSGVANTAA